MPGESDFEEFTGTRFTDDKDDSQDLHDVEDGVFLSSIQKKSDRILKISNGDELYNNRNHDNVTPSKKHEKDTSIKSDNFVQPFSDHHFQKRLQINTFSKSFLIKLSLTLHNSHSSTVTKRNKTKFKTTKEYIKSLEESEQNGDCILPSYRCYWSQELLYFLATDVV